METMKNYYLALHTLLYQYDVQDKYNAVKYTL